MGVTIKEKNNLKKTVQARAAYLGYSELEMEVAQGHGRGVREGELEGEGVGALRVPLGVHVDLQRAIFDIDLMLGRERGRCFRW